MRKIAVNYRKSVYFAEFPGHDFKNIQERFSKLDGHVGNTGTRLFLIASSTRAREKKSPTGTPVRTSI